jgi:ribose/xylose/arabinose/galactoside ABC-type transport system permease subunit
MMLPSITTLLLGLAVVAVLAIVAWYVSRRTPVVPYPLAVGGTCDAEGSDADTAEFKRVA